MIECRLTSKCNGLHLSVNPVLGRRRIHNCLPFLSSVRLCRLRGTCLRASACPRGSPWESKKARSSVAPASPTLRTWRSRLARSRCSMHHLRGGVCRVLIFEITGVKPLTGQISVRQKGVYPPPPPVVPDPKSLAVRLTIPRLYCMGQNCFQALPC
jgi:hypothetical protein